MLTHWFYERRVISAKQNDPLTIEMEIKISRWIEKGNTFKTYHITRNRLQVKGHGFDFVVDLEKRTCSCGKFDIGKLPCRHAIKGAYDIGKCIYSFADDVYTIATWRSLYEETINPIGIPQEEWRVPEDVESAVVLPPETRRQSGIRKKWRYESAEDKIKASQKSQLSKQHKCSRCGKEGHNRATCDLAIWVRYV